MHGSRVEMVNTAQHQHVDQKSKIMEIVLRKLGSSTVLVIPQSVLNDLGLVAGQSVTLHSCADGTITMTRKRKYTLKQLVAQCDLKALPPRDLVLWDMARPVGQEVW